MPTPWDRKRCARRPAPRQTDPVRPTVAVTGATGFIGAHVVRRLRDDWQVRILTRCAVDPALFGTEVEAVPGDLDDRASLERLLAGVDAVVHLAGLIKARSRQSFFRANAEGVGRLMAHCRHARAFLHCSTTGVYEPAGRHPLRETDPLGDNHRAMLPTYSISKIAAEAVVRFASRQFELRTTIARLNVPYGDNGGWPAWHLEFMRAGHPVAVHPDGPNV